MPGDGVQRHHPHPGGQVYRGLAAGLHTQTRHLVQNAAGAALNVEYIVANSEKFHQTVGIVNVRLDAVRHQHAHHVFLSVGCYRQRRHHGAILSTGNADHGGFSAAGLHLLPHPVQQTGQLLLRVKFHTLTLSDL